MHDMRYKELRMGKKEEWTLKEQSTPIYESDQSKDKYIEGVAKQEPNQDYTLPSFERKNRKKISMW